MSKYVDVTLPFLRHGNKRGLSQKQVVEEPWLMDFIKQFPSCFRMDYCMDMYWFEPPEGCDGNIGD